VEADSHLIQCLLYMDLNMVCAGVVGHPSEWPSSGYNEILEPRERYALLDCEGLKELLSFRGMDDLAKAYREWVDESLSAGDHYRDGKWTESVAVGSEAFVASTKERLGVKVKGREVIGDDGSYALRESPAAYEGILRHENEGLSLENTHFWNETR
jgi:putative transposase